MNTAKAFNNIPGLVRWAKAKGILRLKPKKTRYIGTGEYAVKMKPEKRLGINPYTGRKKKLNIPRFLLTDVSPSKRTLKNIPKDSKGKNKVRFQDWLLIKTEPREVGLGRSNADGKWYGWSHRAIYGFKSKEKADAFRKSVS